MTALANACAIRLQDNAYPVKVETRLFHPHVTIAFRDLRRDMFPEAFQYFKEQDFQYTFHAQAVSILKHSQSGWQVVEEVKLGDNINPAES
jgi:2'-5' RNA ligase